MPERMTQIKAKLGRLSEACRSHPDGRDFTLEDAEWLIARAERLERIKISVPRQCHLEEAAKTAEDNGCCGAEQCFVSMDIASAIRALKTTGPAAIDTDPYATIERLETELDGKHPAHGDYQERAQFRDTIIRQERDRAAKIAEKYWEDDWADDIAAAIRADEGSGAAP